MRFAAVIVAGGGGARLGAGEAKQWRLLDGRPVLRWSAETLREAGAAPLVVVIPAGEEARLRLALGGLDGWRVAIGGATRFASMRSGLALVDGDADLPVLIHDAARPFVTAHHVEGLIRALGEAEAAVPALPSADTLKRHGEGAVRTIDRTGLWRAQTPQAFRLGALRRAVETWTEEEPPTDDAALIEAAGGRVALVSGDPMLMKLTWAEDFAIAERLARSARLTCVGQGIDVHRFGPGERVVLCGVEIAHDRGLVGHSDADAGLHALTDAILGALGEGDIGDHFPPSDARWRNADSAMFLRHALQLARDRGARVVHVDVTLVCEQPRIKPHRAAMRARLAQLLSLPAERVSVKATTTEGLGFAGRGEGLLAQAVASVELPA